jgi:acyl-CoA synthetase (AMP-forming)/AMP-acid ligase II
LSFPAAALAAADCGTAILAPNHWTADELSRALGAIPPDQRPDAMLCAGADGRTEVVPLSGARAAQAAEPTLIQFSSGTSGTPAAVPRTLAQVRAEATAYTLAVGLSPDDVVVTTTGLHHAYAFGVGLVAALVAGAAFVPLSAHRPPRSLLRAIARTRPTVVCAVPVLYRVLFALPDYELRAAFASARLLLSAGAPLPDGVRRRAEEVLQVPLTNLYGTTETGALCCEQPGARGGVGSTIPGVEVEVRDRDLVLPDGATGEVFVRAEHAAQEYCGGPGDVFRDGWVRTRDRGRVEAGALHLVGRLDDVINVAGQKVDPVEVEEVLAGLPGVKEVVAVRIGLDTEQQVGVLVHATRPLALDDLRRFAADRLSGFKLPQAFRQVDSIPRTATGKVSRTRLAAEFFGDEP